MRVCVGTCPNRHGGVSDRKRYLGLQLLFVFRQSLDVLVMALDLPFVVQGLLHDLPLQTKCKHDASRVHRQRALIGPATPDHIRKRPHAPKTDR